jgi:hypothetical protein
MSVVREDREDSLCHGLFNNEPMSAKSCRSSVALVGFCEKIAMYQFQNLKRGRGRDERGRDERGRRE